MQALIKKNQIYLMNNISHELFHQIAFRVAIFDAETLKLDVANDGMLELWGRDKSVFNTRLLEFLPELEDQPYPDIMQHVAKTQVCHHEIGAEILLKKRIRFPINFTDRV